MTEKKPREHKKTKISMTNNKLVDELKNDELKKSIYAKIQAKTYNFTEEEQLKITKECRRCKQMKTLNLFCPNATGRLGRHSHCRICNGLKSKEIYTKKRVEANKPYMALNSGYEILCN